MYIIAVRNNPNDYVYVLLQITDGTGYHLKYMQMYVVLIKIARCVKSYELPG